MFLIASPLFGKGKGIVRFFSGVTGLAMHLKFADQGGRFCLGIFWLLPTAVPVADIDWTLHPEMALIKSLDASGNACPSLHVASAVFTALWLRAIFHAVSAPRWLHWASALHCLAILWSTLATRQHVVLDVLAGIVVGGVFALLSLWHARHLQPRGL